jgi:WD40 repeat protein
MDQGKSEVFQNASAEDQQCTDISFFNRNPYKFVTAHNNAIKIWTFDPKMKKLTYFDCPFGHVRRYILNVSIDSIDEHAYCGTRSGDILEVSLTKGIFERSGPVDKKFSGAINQVISKFKDLYVGTSDGSFARVDKYSLLTKGEMTYPGSSISCLAASNSKIYCISNKGIVRSVPETAQIDHTSIFMQGPFDQINSIAFPANYGEVFATASNEEIRVWTNSGRELLKIELM